jgi:ElaB/YqjD/DUF883 family membrane-anchored ribosome-binding protein
MATTRDLENQAEADRAQVALTLEQLRGRMSTGQLFDQAVAYARGHGGAEFMRNLGDHVKVNPLPVALITAGIGWLMAGSRRPAGYAPSIVPDESPYDRRFAHKARETSGEVANSLRESSQGLAERAGRAMAAAREGAEEATSSAHGAMSDARDGLSSAYSAASDAAGRATSTMSDTAAAIGRRAHDARDHAAEFGRGAAEFGRDAADRARQVGSSMSDRAARAQTAMSRLIEEQPLIVGAVGIAIGAMLGAWLPRSRREDELIGEASASVKEQAAGVARDQFDHLKEAGGRFVEKVRGEAEQQGLTPDSAQELARDIGAKVSAVAAAAKEGAVDEMKSAKENAENKIGSAEESKQSKPEPASSEGAHAQEAAGSERFSEVDPRALPTGTGNPADPSLKTAERVG